jgi:hypothetical protein
LDEADKRKTAGPGNPFTAVKNIRSQLVIGHVKSVVRGLSLARTHLRMKFYDIAFS